MRGIFGLSPVFAGLQFVNALFILLVIVENTNLHSLISGVSRNYHILGFENSLWFPLHSMVFALPSLAPRRCILWRLCTLHRENRGHVAASLVPWAPRARSALAGV